MSFLKVFQKKDEKSGDSSGKVRRIDTAARAAAKATPSKAIKPKKAETPKKPAKKSDEPRFAWVSTARQYLREVVSELRRVVWPSRKETLGSTSVVLAIVAICGLFLGIVDFALSRLVHMFVG
jgi:preprotein translocase subunit SecE